MQVTYLEAFLHLDQLKTRELAGFQSWLARIAENVQRDAWKALERKKPSRRKTQQYWSEGQFQTLIKAGPARLSRTDSGIAVMRSSNRSGLALTPSISKSSAPRTGSHGKLTTAACLARHPWLSQPKGGGGLSPE